MITQLACFALVLVPNGGGNPIVLSGYVSESDAETAYRLADPTPPAPPPETNCDAEAKRPNGPWSVYCLTGMGARIHMPIFGRHYVFPAPEKDCRVEPTQ